MAELVGALIELLKHCKAFRAKIPMTHFMQKHDRTGCVASIAKRCAVLAIRLIRLISLKTVYLFIER